MTQKRFRVSQGYTNVFCHDWEKNKLLGFEQTVDCLNRFYEENKQLKQQLTSISYLIDNKIDEFKKGNYGDLPCNTIHMFLDLKEEIGDYSDRK